MDGTTTSDQAMAEETGVTGLEGSWLKLRLKFQERLLGSSPTSASVYQDFCATRALKHGVTPADDEEEALPNSDGGALTGFPRDAQGLFLYDYQLRGFLKEAARALRLKVPGKQKAEVNLTDSLVHQFVHVFPRRLYLTRDGVRIKEPDGVLERPLRAMTMQGPRVTLAASEYVDDGCEIEAKVFIMAGPITPEIVRQLIPYGQLVGLGQWRSGSNGRFTAEVN